MDKISKKEIKPITVHVICWDDIRYDRESDKEEIDRMRVIGKVKESGYNGITFDFRTN